MRFTWLRAMSSSWPASVRKTNTSPLALVATSWPRSTIPSRSRTASHLDGEVPWLHSDEASRVRIRSEQYFFFVPHVWSTYLSPNAAHEARMVRIADVVLKKALSPDDQQMFRCQGNNVIGIEVAHMV